MNKNNKKIIIISFLVGIFVLITIGIMQNQNTVTEIANITSTNNLVANVVPLSGVAEVEAAASDNTGLNTLISTIFTWVLGAAIILSILYVVIGSIQYMTTDAITQKSEGKQKITSAIGGLILALVSWLILNQINPQLVQIRFDINGVGNGTAGSSTVKQIEMDVINQFSDVGTGTTYLQDGTSFVNGTDYDYIQETDGTLTERERSIIPGSRTNTESEEASDAMQRVLDAMGN